MNSWTPAETAFCHENEFIVWLKNVVPERIPRMNGFKNKEWNVNLTVLTKVNKTRIKENITRKSSSIYVTIFPNWSWLERLWEVPKISL